MYGSVALFRKPPPRGEMIGRVSVSDNLYAKQHASRTGSLATEDDDEDEGEEEGGEWIHDKDTAAVLSQRRLDKLIQRVEGEKMQLNGHPMKWTVTPEGEFFADTYGSVKMRDTYGQPLAVMTAPMTLADECCVAPDDFEGRSLNTMIAASEVWIFEIDKYELLHMGLDVLTFAADLFIRRTEDMTRTLQQMYGWGSFKVRLMEQVHGDRVTKHAAKWGDARLRARSWPRRQRDDIAPSP
mmetsp:Transcript_31476/g.73836  ORF Transcript_31476/g.73836 Transcript_31476/m.73836 type:complete len:240 (+) Transcript_31476:1647-2366(+)